MELLVDPPKRRRWLLKTISILLAVAVVALILDGWAFFKTFSKYRDLAATITPVALGKPTKYEVIVVLTGDNTRIPQGLELLRRRGSSRLLVSGTAKGISLTDVANQQGNMANKIRGVWDKIDLESESSSTIENALNSAEHLRRYRADRVILVTSDYHMDRSLALFEAVAPRLEIIAYPVHSPTSKRMESVWKLGIEYWKNRVFRWFYAQRISANSQDSSGRK